MASVVGIVFANINEENIDLLAEDRTAGSVPFGGRYRLIDFVLSSMVNSGVNKVGVVTKNNYQSLMDHLGTGKEWDLARKNGGLILLPPYGRNQEMFNSRLEALKSINHFIEKCQEDYVVLSDCDIVYNIDFDAVIEEHEKKKAEITMVYRKNIKDKNKRVVALEIDETEKVTDICLERNDEDIKINQYMKVMVMKKSLLQSLVLNAITHGRKDFLMEILNRNLSINKTFAYEYKGFYANINCLPSYFEANMTLLKQENRDMLFGKPNQAIYTKVKDSSPTKYGANAVVKNSFIADGCIILGTVENSIIFRGTKVEEGAEVKNSIIMQSGYIGANSRLEYVVADKNVVFCDSLNISACRKLPYFVRKGSRI